VETIEYKDVNAKKEKNPTFNARYSVKHYNMQRGKGITKSLINQKKSQKFFYFLFFYFLGHRARAHRYTLMNKKLTA